MNSQHPILIWAPNLSDAQKIEQALHTLQIPNERHLTTPETDLPALLTATRMEVAIVFDSAGAGALPRKAIAEECPFTAIIEVLREFDEEAMVRAFQRGAVDCLSHDRLDRLAAAVQRILSTTEPAATGPEEQHRRALEMITQRQQVIDQHIIVATTDARGRITSANDKFCELSGYDREELLGQDHRILNSRHHPKEFFRELWKTIHRGEIWQGEIRNQAKDGSHYWVDTVIIPQRSPGSEKPTGYISIRTDITRLKNMEADLQKARDEAMEASKLKSEFLANMSHEIRTPMNGIIGMSGLLLESGLSSAQYHMAEIIQSSSENLLAIINDVLDFSSIEAGKMRIDTAEFDLGRLVVDTSSLLRPMAEKKNLRLICDYPERPTEYLRGDPGRIRQVLTNLIGNATKFTDAGGIFVSVKIRRETEHALRFRVNVRDTGCGIAAADQKKLFDAFVQVDGTLTRQHEGTGLGLAISRQIIHLMGGAMGVESRPDHGSNFWFELELPRRTESQEETLRSRKAARRVLVVDDNPNNREIIERQLSNHGVETRCFADATTALRRLVQKHQEDAWDLILLDHHMPGVSGIDLARAIRSDPAIADIPLVMLSSTGASIEIDHALALGFEAILTKPVRDEQIHRLVLNTPPAEARRPPRHKPHRRDSEGNLTLKILLAEDNRSNQDVAHAILTGLGHTVEIADDGLIALQKLAEAEFDVILMDCQMPHLDGLETTRRIRNGAIPGTDPKVPIIALTAHALPQDRLKCLEAGMDAHVCKPIRPAELRQALDFCLPQTPAEKEGPTTADQILDPLIHDDLIELGKSNGNDLFAKVAENFLQQAPHLLAIIKEKRGEPDPSTIAPYAHSLANTASAIGALLVREACFALEKASQVDEPSQLGRSIESVEARLDEATRALRKRLKTRPVIQPSVDHR